MRERNYKKCPQLGTPFVARNMDTEEEFYAVIKQEEIYPVMTDDQAEGYDLTDGRYNFFEFKRYLNNKDRTHLLITKDPLLELRVNRYFGLTLRDRYIET